MENQLSTIPRAQAESLNPIISGDPATTLSIAQKAIRTVQDIALYARNDQDIEYGGVWSVLECVNRALEYEAQSLEAKS